MDWQGIFWPQGLLCRRCLGGAVVAGLGVPVAPAVQVDAALHGLLWRVRVVQLGGLFPLLVHAIGPCGPVGGVLPVGEHHHGWVAAGSDGGPVPAVGGLADVCSS
jgi:hypothetical protein